MSEHQGGATAAMDDTATKARQEAEARRQRILDSADQRMERVEGNTVSKKTTTTSSKLAAMRQRRFKKKPKDAVAKETVSKETEDEPKLTKEEPIVTKKTTEEPPAEPIPEASNKKKYQGVAKMRRRMNKEKQVQQSTKEEQPPIQLSTKQVPKTAAKSKLPILLNGLVVVLLFLAGLDVGLQQGQQQQHPLLLVHSDFAPRTLGGLQKIQQWTMASSPTKQQPDETILPPYTSEYDEEDEFATLVDDDTTLLKDTQNIDPLFRVDLDRLTQGRSPIYMAARLAVRVHRWNLSIFYYGPQSFFNGLAAFLLSFGRFPPVFCLLAIFIRQVLGKMILGAKLPEKKSGSSKDVITMAKNFVSGMFVSKFPIVVSLYDIWTHVRADMYVVLCGFFVGVCWVHNAAAISPYDAASSYLLEEETNVGMVQEQQQQELDQVPVGVSDEL